MFFDNEPGHSLEICSVREPHKINLESAVCEPWYGKTTVHNSTNFKPISNFNDNNC